MDIKRTFPHWAFRRKLLLFLLIILLPALGIIIASGVSQRQAALARAQDDALLLVRSLAAQQEQIAMATKAMLSTLAQLPEVQNLDPACSRIFHELYQRYPFYASILAMTLDGYVFAAHTPVKPGTVNQSDRKYFLDAIRSLDFSAGDYIIGRVSQKGSLNYSLPVLDANQQLVAVLTAGINLQKLGQFISAVRLPEGSAVLFTDYKGIRLYRLPENDAAPIGKPVPPGLFNIISGQAEEGLLDRKAPDDVTRILAFKRLRLQDNLLPYLYIIVGLPKGPILHKANMDMLENLAILGFATLVALSLAWVFGNCIFIQPINRLVAATRQFGMGKMGTRTGLPHSPDELGRLAQSFDDMASLLEARNIERERAEEALNQAYTEMEGRVQERTAELTASNAALLVEISERKQAEEALRDNEQFLTDIFNSIQDGLIILNPDFTIIRVNPAMEKLPFGQPMVGRKCYEVLHGRSEPCEVCLAQQVFQTGQPGEKVLTLTGDDGSPIFVEIHAFPLLNRTTGQVDQVVEILRNITGRKRSEAERLRFSKLESLSTLAGGIAHDFNNILTAILGNIGLAMLEGKIGPKVQDRLSQAEQACLRAKALSQQLLTFAKGGAPIKKIISISKLLNEAAGLTLAGSKSRCEFSISKDLWLVEADEGQINQVISNLLINADQAMPEGGIIQIKAEDYVVEAKSDLPIPKGEYVKLTIADQGIGISPQYLDKIFDPYFTTKQKGSGLGLGTAYSIIKNHAGHLQVESQVGVGTTFQIYLPATDKRAPAEEPETVKPTLGQGKVLVMDDEETVRYVLGGMLNRLGYEVDFASDGSEAIEKFVKVKESGRPFDAVILDLTIPGGMGGKETSEKLLKIDPQIKAIVSSGYSDDQVMANFKEYGFSEVISKPYRVVELNNVLQRVISKKGN